MGTKNGLIAESSGYQMTADGAIVYRFKVMNHVFPGERVRKRLRSSNFLPRGGR